MWRSLLGKWGSLDPCCAKKGGLNGEVHSFLLKSTGVAVRDKQAFMHQSLYSACRPPPLAEQRTWDPPLF